MEITTGILEHHGVLRIGLRMQLNEEDNDCVSYVFTPEVARQVAFGLMERADEVSPPIWRD